VWGSVNGTLTVLSNATNSPATIALSGTGVQSVDLTWIPALQSWLAIRFIVGVHQTGPM
jgi:hypothetical protein